MSSVGLVGNQSERMETRKDTTTKTDERIEEIFRELDISGDIYPLEEAEDYWKRKLIEVYEECVEEEQ